MSEHVLLEHCSPTLAGLKTGNMVSCTFATKEEVQADLRRWNRLLRAKGLRIIPLRYMKNRVLLYVYRPKRLKADLASEQVQSLLGERGYSSEHESLCICTLIRHLKEESSFPHEIGLFLGYPPEDVLGFIKDSSAYQYAGLWKVYGQVEERKALFETYRRCTESYRRQHLRGRTLEELAVRC